MTNPTPTLDLIPLPTAVMPTTPPPPRRSHRLATTGSKPPKRKASDSPGPNKRRRLRSSSSSSSPRTIKKPVYYSKVRYDDVVFEIGDDVYVKRNEVEDEEEPEVEDCRICYKLTKSVMVECEECLGGFHLRCLSPPLRKVPEGEWVCAFCRKRKEGAEVEFPKPPEGRKVRKTAKEKLLGSELWAAKIESLWKDPDGMYWAKVCWYMIPEETAAGRQGHNLRRELYRTNHLQDIEMESVIRHCYVMNPKEFSKANNEGDDVFFCEYEYDIHQHSFKRIADANGSEDNDDEAVKDKDWGSSNDYDSDSEIDSEHADESLVDSPAYRHQRHDFAANSQKGRIFGLQRIGIKRIPEHVRRHKQTELERAKAALALATLPKTLPCRNKEMTAITTFLKGAIGGDQCLGRCLYIHGVPGTGKTMSVLAVVKSLKSEVDAGDLSPYSFVEINCLKLASPENIYKVIYETLSGHRVGWKKALHLLNERFSESSSAHKSDGQPCVILIDELDLLVTRNQSVLYNILDWPTKPNSRLVIIGIANTMDLPEKLVPRISSRMGIQRLCFSPYIYEQLQEIISCRLNGINAFNKGDAEYVSRKVASISGDARRALEVCRRAAELADYRLKQSKSETASESLNDSNKEKFLVAADDVVAAIEEMFKAPHIQVIKNCSRLSKIVLAAMVHELYKTGMSEVTFEKLAMAVSNLCTSNGETIPEWGILLKISCKLGECKIILCEEAAMHRLQKLQLNFPSNDVVFALKGCKEVPWLEKYL